MTLIIPFPSRLRSGHARKVAVQLATARTRREANHFLNRAIEIHERQLFAALIHGDKIDQERSAFLYTIHEECRKLGSTWRPEIPEDNRPGGAA
ncbi:MULTISPECIES: DUF6074 family protein [Rhizobium]|uniref:DUF6074 family protein n=1 Tax=Rhizobium TaxID=379 RepID=UPI001C82AABA|nr:MULTISPECIES: DUF6074 family protein [Rhizobium]MBX4895437.1 hypothetical protein [Rhizobium bangladeshense]MBX5217861.1 hypothetical protein [Rhizobium sp. NLR9a]